MWHFTPSGAWGSGVNQQLRGRALTSPGTTLSQQKHSQAPGSCPGSLSRLAGPCPAASSCAARGGLAIMPKTLLGKDTNHIHVKKPFLLRPGLLLRGHGPSSHSPAVHSHADPPEQK